MTASLAEVVAQLISVRDRLATAVISVVRTQGEAADALSKYREASRGSSHPLIKQAIAALEEAEAKTGRVARVLDQSREHFIRYLDRIAPGSGTSGETPVPFPTGEQLLTEAAERADSRKSMNAYLGKTTRNIENLQEISKSTVKATEKVVKIVRASGGPAGTQQPATTAPATIQPPPPRSIEPSDAVGNIVALGLIAGVAIHRASQFAKRKIARIPRRESQARTERSDSSDGPSRLGDGGSSTGGA